jgi:uncharacterized glyoxalase superfamily protein PhnB
LGATIITDVEADQYGKRYRAEDLEGHRWMFMQRADRAAQAPKWTSASPLPT